MHMEMHHVTDASTGRVYHVVFADEGLYLVHVTNENGMNDYAGGSAKIQVTNKSTERYGETYIDGEEELGRHLTEEVMQNEHSRYFTFGEIRNIAATFHSPRTLTLETDEAVYRLEFKDSPPERVEKFCNLLTQAVGQERNANEELKR